MTLKVTLKPLSVLLCASALSLSACGQEEGREASDKAPTTRDVVPTVQQPQVAIISSADALALLREGTSERDDQDLVEIYASEAEDYDMQRLSNGLWSGSVGVTDRELATRVADAAYVRTPSAWSALRSGIGYVSGAGLEKDAEMAVQRLSSASLQDNSAAAYFLSRAYAQSGDADMQRQALQNAAALGHPRASEELRDLDAE